MFQSGISAGCKKYCSFLCCLHSNTYYTVVNNCSTFKWTEADKKAAFENSIFAAYGNKGYLTGNFMDKIENSLQENLNIKILKRYGKCIILWLIAGLLFYSGMKNYCNIEKNNTAVTCLYGNFPDQQKVKEVWESWQKRELITDICFVSNQGMEEVEVSRYARQKAVQVITGQKTVKCSRMHDKMYSCDLACGGDTWYSKY